MGELLQVEKLNLQLASRSAPPTSIRYDKAARFPFPVFNKESANESISGRSTVNNKPSSSINIGDYRIKTVQKMSHQRILAIGMDVNQRVEQSIEDERERLINETRALVWKDADVRQAKALETLRSKMQAEERKAIDKLNRLHQRGLHEKLANLEAALKREASEDLEAHKKAAKIELETALQKLNEQWEEKLRIAIEATRQEERLKAEMERKKLIEAHEKETKTLKDQLKEEKHAALRKQKEELKQKRQERERILRLQEHEKRLLALAEQKFHHEQQVASLMDLMEQGNRIQNQLRQQLFEMNEEKEAAEAEVLRSRKSFMDYIHRVLRLHTGQADYLLPMDELVAKILQRMDASRTNTPTSELHIPLLFPIGVPDISTQVSSIQNSHRAATPQPVNKRMGTLESSYRLSDDFV